MKNVEEINELEPTVIIVNQAEYDQIAEALGGNYA